MESRFPEGDRLFMHRPAMEKSGREVESWDGFVESVGHSCRKELHCACSAGHRSAEGQRFRKRVREALIPYRRKVWEPRTMTEVWNREVSMEPVARILVEVLMPMEMWTGT